MPLPNTEDPQADPFDLHREYLRAQMKLLTGLDDVSGIELATHIRVLGNLYDMVIGQNADEGEMSGPRWGLLMRLYGEEKKGNTRGITPTAFSHSHRVSKNTISALLRGLEEQGLIRRELDSADRRIFHIQLTQAGRERVQSNAPAYLVSLNQMASTLSHEERSQLNALLEKLHRTLRAAYCLPERKPDGG
jgi:DNA-binding MarR family transcriptional regulator